MRILMLAQFYPPTMGGEEQHVRTLSLALARRGHQVAVATLRHSGLPEFELDQTVRVYRLPSTMGRAAFMFSESDRRHAAPFPDPETMWALRGVIARERPEIVHAHNWLVHSFLPLKSWSGARLVVTLHDYSLICAQKRLMNHGVPCSGPELTKCLDCAVAHYGPVKGLTTVTGNWAFGIPERRSVDLFLAVSQATADGNGLPAGRVPYQVIPNFLLDEQDEENDAASFLDQLPAKDYILFVGDVTPDKGVNVLLRAYSGIEQAPPLVLIGRVSDQSPRDLPPDVKLMGSWPHHAVMQAWRRSLFGVQPSQVPETFGIAVLEAMSMERPVIASRIGGLSDIIIDGETGFLVPPGDALALRRALDALLRDPARRVQMGQAARVRAAEFHAARIVPRIEQTYQQLLDREVGREEKISEGASAGARP